MLTSAYAKIMVLASAIFCGAAIWRLILAVQHYSASLKIIDDPSIRELEAVSASFEIGFAIVLLGHAVVAVYLVRRPLQLDAVVIGTVAALVGVIIAASFLHIPILGAAAMLPAVLLPACAIAGLISHSPWLSAYLGAVLGSSLGFYLGTPAFEPFAMLAVMTAPVTFALAGVSLGKLLRRFGPFRRKA